jgi:hypothetical protein
MEPDPDPQRCIFLTLLQKARTIIGAELIQDISYVTVLSMGTEFSF